jgi:hypothetical protein
MSFYRVDIKMDEEKLIKAFSKLINSDVAKSIYPMLDHIDIVEVNDNPNFIGYDMSVNIFLNDPTIDKNNMYSMNFDPHYLVEKHLKELSKYLGLEFHRITFKLFGPDGKLLLNWD